MNKQILLKERPEGLPTAATWTLNDAEIPELADGEILIKNEFISLDPAMRGWLRDVRSYIPPVGINEVMRAGSLGRVLKANNHPKFKEGDVLVGTGGVQQYIVSNGKGFLKVEEGNRPLTEYLGVLGMPGMTAYFGILEVGELKDGETVVVSGAAGAVGSVVGQIAKIKGCKVIGIAGGKAKCDYLVNELGFDAAIDYKSENIYTAIKEHCPKGIDVYFDNVGGEILDAALSRLAMHARIVICGAISQYNNTEKVAGPSNYMSLLVNRASMKGMVVFDYASRYHVAREQMEIWLNEGKLKSKEDVYEGIENFNDTLLRLFDGNKQGKLILKVSED
ncbi:NADP-dependent oxidoreductase [uncultured Arcticibacterium sp.]|uniref:NADP-dependent oxidoreductase n=1 Tax=uncultured Arcticibacterium sp. TaxID=2173042 RepID=UPI0030F9935A